MRKIKFRAWDKKKKKMYYFGDKECPDFMSLNGKIVYSDDNHRPDFCESERYIPLQYTGLKDKNGKEIYEGDIVRGPDKLLYLIFWDNPSAGFKLDDLGRTPKNKRYNVDFSWDDIEVIGDVYENKDLLK